MSTRDLIDYIEGLPITQGQGVGGPFRLFPWERRFLRGAFKKSVVESGLSVARANGKTTLTAGIAASAVDPVGPLHTPRGEVVLTASSYLQAKIAGEAIAAFLRSKYDLTDKRVWRYVDNHQRFSIEHKPTGARVRCIGSDPKRAHGLQARLILADEPAQWPVNMSERMIAALRTSNGKIPGFRLIALGTRAPESDHWFSRMLEGGADYSQVHAARKDDPPFRKSTWRKANPSLPYMPELEAALRREAKLARRDAMVLPSFQALRLNLGVADVGEAMLIEAATWKEIEGDAAPSGDYVLGIDTGQNKAMSAAAAYWPKTGRLETLAAFPLSPTLSERGLADGVGTDYVRMAARGELITAGELVTDIAALLETVLDRWGRPRLMVCDTWRRAELGQVLTQASFPLTRLTTRRNGPKDGTEDCRNFQRACLEGYVTPVESLLLRSAMAAARLQADTVGNAWLAKKTASGRRRNARDDAVAASILAVSAGYPIAQRGITTASKSYVIASGYA